MAKYNAKARREWIKALLSGDFRQARGKLCREGNKRKKFCCLGVALALEGATFTNGSVYIGDEYVVENSGSSLPAWLRAKLGISVDDTSTLAEMNDGDLVKDVKKHSFKKIAEHIRNLPITKG